MTMSLTGNASQATQIEQARAVAEVAAAVRYAHDNPRDEDRAILKFKASCARLEFAKRSSWRYRRGGEMLTGRTIQFALEAARCWQNMATGSAELVRHADRSEMLAFAWDLETNTQRRLTFVSPHSGYTDTPKLDEQSGIMVVGRKLVAMRDVRENNQSAASRVEREAILAVLPSWFIEIGTEAVTATVAGQGGGKPIEERRRTLIERFESRFSVRREELIAKIGLPVDQWIEADLATLEIIGTSIARGETAVEQEFERRPGGATTKIPAPAAPDKPEPTPTPAAGVDTPPAEGEAPAQPDEPLIDKPGMNHLFAALGNAGLKGRKDIDRARRLRLCELLVDHDLESSADLKATEGRMLIETIESWGDQAAETAAAMLEQDEEERAAPAAPDENGATTDE